MSRVIDQKHKSENEFNSSDLTERVNNLSNVKLRLGTNLINKINETADNYMNRGGMIGSVIGLATGGTLGYEYLANPGQAHTNPLIFGSFIGLMIGLNAGAAFGRMYGTYKVKQLK